MEDSITTMAIPLSADMAPVATIVVWSIGRYGDVTADSLTFPVNGISRNKVKCNSIKQISISIQYFFLVYCADKQ